MSKEAKDLFVSFWRIQMIQIIEEFLHLYLF